MRVLLINPIPKGGFEPPFPVLPLGISLIAAVATDLQADVTVFSGSEFRNDLDNYLLKFRPDIVGMQTFINNISLCFSIAEEIKIRYPDTLIVLGGVEVSNNPESAFNSPYIDCTISGEGEKAFRNLLLGFQDDFRTVPGLIWRDESGEIKRNPGAGQVENLDDLPEIPYHLFYTASQTPIGHILTHRGCPHHCSHCPLQFRAGVTIRAHSVQRISETIRYLNEQYGIRFIEFYDENFTMHPDLVQGICETTRRLNIAWKCTARISELDSILAEEMGRSGCKEILFGIGSGVPRLQEVLGTEESLEKATRLIEILPRFGIRPVVAFSLGIPTETRQEFQATVRYGLNLKNAQIRFEPAAPLPGTQLYELSRSGGRFLIESWEKYTMPGQLIYLPAGRNLFEFKASLYWAKFQARLHGRKLKGVPNG